MTLTLTCSLASQTNHLPCYYSFFYHRANSHPSATSSVKLCQKHSGGPTLPENKGHSNLLTPPTKELCLQRKEMLVGPP